MPTQIRGQQRTCKRYKRGKGGVLRCAAFGPGAKTGGKAAPSKRARKGAKRKFNRQRAGEKVAKRTIDACKAVRKSGPMKGKAVKGCQLVKGGKAKCDADVAKARAKVKCSSPKKKSAAKGKKRSASKRKTAAKKRRAPAKKRSAKGKKRSASKRRASTKKQGPVERIDLCKAQRKSGPKKGTTVTGCRPVGGGKAECTQAVARKRRKIQCEAPSKPKKKGAAKGKKVSSSVRDAYQRSVRGRGTRSGAMAASCRGTQVKVHSSLTTKKDGTRRDGCTNRGTCSVMALQRFAEGRSALRQAQHAGRAPRCN